MSKINQYKRKSGILLHISSLPDKFGIGTFGKEAYKFIDFLKETKQSLWQVLPLGHTGYGNSPYSSYSAFAGNPLFIDISDYIEKSDNVKKTKFPPDKVSYTEVSKFKISLLKKIAYKSLNNENLEEFNVFCNKNKFWLEDYAFFISLKDLHKQKSFFEFGKDIFLRKKKTLNEFKDKLKLEIKIWKYIQFMFFEQWNELKKYANNSGIEIIGDIPLYVAGDSVDLWSKPEIFMLDKNNFPEKVAGVPPDYFSETGQLWGNPLYDWQNNEKEVINWWIKRIKFNAQMYDYVRIDHFRGLSEFWAVDAGEKTAEKGKWLPASGNKLLKEVFKQMPDIKIIAEDLGVITPEVEKLRDKYLLPGMKILQFAFESAEQNDFLPHRYKQNTVVYTGTHDNDTTKSWLKSLNKKGKKHLCKYTANQNPKVKDLIRLAWSSCADISIVPMQDVLQLGNHARMNTPGKAENNWEWRFQFSDIKDKQSKFLKKHKLFYTFVKINIHF